MRKLILRKKSHPHDCRLLLEGGYRMVQPLKDIPGEMVTLKLGFSASIITLNYFCKKPDPKTFGTIYHIEDVDSLIAMHNYFHMAVLLYAHKAEQLYEVLLDQTHVPIWRKMLRKIKMAHSKHYHLMDIFIQLLPVDFRTMGGWIDKRYKLQPVPTENMTVPKESLNALRAEFKDYFKEKYAK